MLVLMEETTVVYRARRVEMLLPLLKIARHDPSATVIVLPADHGIDHEARFLRYVSRAVWAVALRPDLPILIGAHPHAPLGNGWIEPGAPVDGLEDLAVHTVKRFVDAASLVLLPCNRPAPAASSSTARPCALCRRQRWPWRTAPRSWAASSSQCGSRRAVAIEATM